MSRRYVVAGSASQTFNVFLQDRSSGDGVITLTTDKVKAAYSIGSTGPVTTFALVGRNSTASWTASGTTHGWAEVSSTLAPGLYKLDVPNASIASTPSVTYFVQCSTPGSNFIPVAMEVQVVSSGGSDMPSDFILYKGMAQSSVDIGAMLTSVNSKVTSVDTKVTSIDSRLTSMDTMLSSVNSKVTSVDTKVTSMNTQVTSILANVTSINAKVTSIDTDIDTVITKVTSIDSRLSSMDTMLTSVNSKVTSVDSRLTSMDTMLSSVNSKVTSIDTDVDSIITKVTSIDSRLTSMDTMLTSVNSYTTSKTAIADAFLDRDMSSGTDSGTSAFRTPRQALRLLRNKWEVSAGTLTVYKEDDTNASWSAAVTSDATADPITSIDPA